MPCSRAVQPAADSRAQSLHSAMTLGVQGPAAFRFCVLLPTLPSLHAHALPFNASARSHSSHADTGSFYWYCAQLLHQAAAARSARLAHACDWSRSRSCRVLVRGGGSPEGRQRQQWLLCRRPLQVTAPAVVTVSLLHWPAITCYCARSRRSTCVHLCPAPACNCGGSTCCVLVHYVRI